MVELKISAKFTKTPWIADGNLVNCHRNSGVSIRNCANIPAGDKVWNCRGSWGASLPKQPKTKLPLASTPGGLVVTDPMGDDREHIQNFIFRVTIPILFDHGGAGIDQVGTGTLFSIADRYFFITAQHVIDEFDLRKIAFPETPRGIATHRFGRHAIIGNGGSNIDVAVLELLDDIAIQKLKKGWQCLTPRNLSTIRDLRRYVVAGYPSKLVIKRGNRIGGTLVTIYTDKLYEWPENADPPPDTRFDLFFYYGRSAEDRQGYQAELPRLNGISGSPVWQYEPEGGAPSCAPESVVKVIAIQTGYRYGEYIRATDWRVVAKMLKRADRHLAEAFGTGTPNPNVRSKRPKRQVSSALKKQRPRRVKPKAGKT